MVAVPVILRGPRASRRAKFALDTGATLTVVAPGLLQYLGCEPPGGARPIRVRTAGGEREAQVARLDQLVAPGVEQQDLMVVGLAPPGMLGISGLLGLDFFRGRRLVIDFRVGTIDLE